MTKRAIVFTAALVLLGVSGFTAFATATRVHVIRDHQTTTQMLWNHKRAYLAIGMRRDGWDGNRAEYLWQVLTGMLGKPFQFDESRTWLVFAEIGPNGVRTVIRDGEAFQFLRPFEDAIYKQFGQTAKWNGQQFETVTDSEARRFKDAQTSGSAKFSNVAGWSGEINLLNQGTGNFQYPLKLEGVMRVVTADRTDPVRPRIRITGESGDVDVISVDERFRIVEAQEYEALMRKAMTK